MMINCLAIDDEPFALRQMADYIEKVPFLTLMGTAASAMEVLETIHKKEVNLLFLDINMPGLSGMELAKNLPENCHVVFTTAYSEHAAESYRVNALDYLLKPISYEDFLQAANKALKYIIRLNTRGQKADKTLRHFFIKADGIIQRVEFDEVSHIEGMSEYIRIHRYDKKALMCLTSLKSMCERLPTDEFMRVHKSFIINLNRIQTVERKHIILGNGIRIPLSAQYKDAFKSFINRNYL